MLGLTCIKYILIGSFVSAAILLVAQAWAPEDARPHVSRGEHVFVPFSDKDGVLKTVCMRGKEGVGFYSYPSYAGYIPSPYVHMQFRRQVLWDQKGKLRICE